MFNSLFLSLLLLSMLCCRHSAGERDAQNELNNRILVQRNSRKKILEWRRIAQDLGDRSMQVSDDSERSSYPTLA